MAWPPDFIRFASDATVAGLWGGGLLGWVPWRDLSALTAFAGLVLMAMAASGWMKA
jgi:hypothetical protein